MYQSAEFITELISETETIDISDPSPQCRYLGRVIRIIFTGDREASDTQLMLVRVQKLERKNCHAKL